MLDVFGTDMTCVDLNVVIPEMPERNTGTRVQDLSWQGGGKVSTGICACARLLESGAAAPRCAWAGALGDDAYGKFLYKDFRDHGLDLSGVKIRAGQTTSLDVVVSEKNYSTRSLLFRAGTAEMLAPDEVDWELLKQAKYFFISGFGPVVEEGLRIARENGVKIFIDADGDSPELRQHVKDIDIFIGSEFVFDAFFPGAKWKGLDDLQEELEKVRTQGPEIVVFTFGELGCVGLSEEGYFRVPAFKVDVVDTVGAGDVFHGAFLAGLIEGKSVKDCAVMASATSAIKCTRIGGRSGIPNRQVLAHFLEAGEIDYEEIDERVNYYRRAIDYV